MSNIELFNQKEFPVWESYNITNEEINEVRDWYDNDINLMAENICNLMSFKKYFKDMLLYIQRKVYLDEPLKLCLDSSKEVFGIMITPCETLNDEGKELTLDDYEDVSEWTVESEDKDDPMSRQYMLCKTCDFATDDTFKFEEHKCVLDEE